MDAKRRLLWHGVLLALLGLVTGLFVQSFPNPRMGLTAHVAGVMTGTLVAVLGVAWGELRLAPRTATALFWTTVFAGYANWGALVLAAILRTSSMTPIAGAGHTAALWREAVVNVTLIAGAVTIIAACVLFLRGLGRRG